MGNENTETFCEECELSFPAGTLEEYYISEDDSKMLCRDCWKKMDARARLWEPDEPERPDVDDPNYCPSDDKYEEAREAEHGT